MYSSFSSAMHQLLPSRPGELHPEPLTEPDMTLSRHPARAIRERPAPFVQIYGFLLLPVDPIRIWMTHPLRSTPITGASTLLRGGPPLIAASVFLPRGFCRLRIFPFHLRSSSQVPYERLNESRASYTPDTAWPVSKLLPCSSQNREKTLVSMSSHRVSMLPQRFICIRLSHPYLTQSCRAFSLLRSRPRSFDISR